MLDDQLIADLRTAVLKSRSAKAPRVKDLQQTLQKYGDEAVEALEPLLHDRNIRVSEAAADVLQAIGSERAYGELVAYALRHLKDPTERTKLPGPGWRRLEALGKAVLPAMRRAYADQLFDTRLSMIRIAQQIGDPAALPLLEAALAEPDSRLVEAAAEALGRVDGPAAYERLVQLLASKDVQHRLGAIRGLELMANPAAVEPLLGVLLAEDQPYVQWGASPLASVTATLHHAASRAINVLTGEPLNGDVARIRHWVEEYLRK